MFPNIFNVFASLRITDVFSDPYNLTSKITVFKFSPAGFPAGDRRQSS
jgi:hypothetical protein